MSHWPGLCVSFVAPYASYLSVGEIVQIMEQSDVSVKDAAVDTL